MALWSWIEYTRSGGGCDTLLAKSCASRTRRRFPHSTWRERCLVVARMKSRANEIVARSLAWMRRSTEMKAFTMWCELARDGAHSRAVLRQVVSRMVNRVLAGAWAAWADAVQQMVHMRVVLTRTVARMQNGAIASSFLAWQEHVQSRLRCWLVELSPACR